MMPAYSFRYASSTSLHIAGHTVIRDIKDQRAFILVDCHKGLVSLVPSVCWMAPDTQGNAYLGRIVNPVCQSECSKGINPVSARGLVASIAASAFPQRLFKSVKFFLALSAASADYHHLCPQGYCPYHSNAGALGVTWIPDSGG